MAEAEINDFRIAEAVRLINSKFDQNLDFNELAKALNLSRSRLRHLFKAETGMSFRKYVQMVRMKQAKHLLETSFLPVNEIAKQVGIRDSSRFGRDFKKHFGLSPHNYRKRHLQAKENHILKVD